MFSQAKTNHKFAQAIAPTLAGLTLFESSAKEPAKPTSFETNPPAPIVLEVSASKIPKDFFVAQAASAASTNASLPSEPSIERPAPKSTLGKIARQVGDGISTVQKWLYNAFGQQTVDIAVLGYAAFQATRGAIRLFFWAKLKRYPDSISVYVVEPARVNSSSKDEELSTRTLVDSDIRTIYDCCPDAVKAIRHATKAARKHPELPILFFERPLHEEVFSKLKVTVSSGISFGLGSRAAVHNANYRFASIGDGKNQPYIPMEKVFLVFTWERYGVSSIRAVFMPARDVISLLAEPERWYNAALRVPIDRDRDQALRRLVRHLEIASCIALRNPELVEHYCEERPKVWQTVQRNAQFMRKMLVLEPKESLDYVERWISDPGSLEATLTVAEEERLQTIWAGPRSKQLSHWRPLRQTTSSCPTGCQKPLTTQDSNWFTVMDFPVM